MLTVSDNKELRRAIKNVVITSLQNLCAKHFTIFLEEEVKSFIRGKTDKSLSISIVCHNTEENYILIKAKLK